MQQDRPCYFHQPLDDDQVAPRDASQPDHYSESEVVDLRNQHSLKKKKYGEGNMGKGELQYHPARKRDGWKNLHLSIESSVRESHAHLGLKITDC